MQVGSFPASVLFVFLALGVAWAQETSPNFARISGRGIAIAPDGNLVVVGHTEGHLRGQPRQGETDLFLAKLDPTDGDLLWVRTFGSEGDDRITGFGLDGAGNAYVAGNTTGRWSQATQDGPMYVLKFSPEADVLWAWQSGAHTDNVAIDFLHDLGVRPEGGVYVVGSRGAERFSGRLSYWYPGPYRYSDAFVASLDADGQPRWWRELQVDATQRAEAITIDSNGNLLVVGSASREAWVDFYSFLAFGFLASYRPDGGLRYLQRFGETGGTGVLVGTTMTVSVDGELHMTESGRHWIFDLEGRGRFVDLVDRDGGFLGHAIAAGGDGRMIVAGSGRGVLGSESIGREDVVIVQHDHAGALTWVVQLGTADKDDALALVLDDQGRIYVTGYFGGVSFDPHDSAGLVSDGLDWFVAAYTMEGEELWLRTYRNDSVDE